MRTAENMQLKILEYIKEEISVKGYPPSVREICSAVGLRSTSSVHAHLNSLEKKGLIRRDPTKPRALEVTDGIAPRGKVLSCRRITSAMMKSLRCASAAKA